MSILVTGGAGFIGSHVIDRLVSMDRTVVCIDDFNDFYDPEIKRANISRAMSSGKVKLYRGDICNKELCEKVFKRENVQHVIHLAARAGVRPSIKSPLLYARVNIEGTIILLDMAVKYGVKRFLLGSTSSIYGINHKVPFSEDDPVRCPISPYASSKRAAELYSYTYHHLYGLPVVCLRFFTVYGPRQRPDLAISKFARLIMKDEPIPVFGDGSSKRDYTYCSDIVSGITAALEQDIDFEIVNLGNSSPVELRTLIHMIEEAVGRKAVIEQLPVQPGDVPITYADISKAGRLLGYSPEFPIEKGIREFIQWLRQASRSGE